MARGAPPDGYRWTGNGMEIVLIDPVDCPRGHPFQFGQRTYSPCSAHGGHPAWWCACGAKMIRRSDGVFVASWVCE